MLWSHEQLVPWFNESTNLERELYARPDGIVQTLLANRSSFALCTVVDNERTIKFIRDCVDKHGYHPILVGIHVAENIGLTRLIERNNSTGRFMPSCLIQHRSTALQAMFGIAAQCV